MRTLSEYELFGVNAAVANAQECGDLMLAGGGILGAVGGAIGGLFGPVGIALGAEVGTTVGAAIAAKEAAACQ